MECLDGIQPHACIAPAGSRDQCCGSRLARAKTTNGNVRIGGRLVELMIFVVALCILGVLAIRFGHDSRLPVSSKEQDLANLGLSWRSSDQPDENTIPDMRRDICQAPAPWRGWIRTLAAWRDFQEENAP